jgi:uncharacterized protein (DUF362 family)
MSRVALVRCTDDPLQAVRESLALCADIRIPVGGTVFVKPNLHGGHGFTSPCVIEAVCRWAYEQGAGRVQVGDGPYWSQPLDETRRYFEKVGLYRAAERSGAEAVNLHALPYRSLRPGRPGLPEEIGLTSLLFEADVVINLPLLKTHLNTLVTLGIKNLKGFLRPEDKRRFHEMELNAAIAELCRLVSPRITVTLLDATTVVEGLGPAAGTELQMDLLAASTDVVAVDSVACFLAGIDPREVRIIRQCARMGVGQMDLDQIDVVGEDPAVHRRRLRRPYEDMAGRFPGLAIVAEGACSGCVMNLFGALGAIEGGGERVQVPAVAIGPRARMKVGLAVGDCAAHCGDGCQHLPGCPPSTAEIHRALCGDPAS